MSKMDEIAAGASLEAADSEANPPRRTTASGELSDTELATLSGGTKNHQTFLVFRFKLVAVKTVS